MSNQDDIIKYNIGFCKDGKYGGRVIIPSYDNDKKLNYFIARDYKGETPQKYKNPPVAAKDVIGFELYINWDAPIVLVEGMFDALTIKRNVIPLFGKAIHGKLMEKLVKSSVDRIYIALDQDARRDALKQAEMLMSYGKEIYLVEMEGKDANEIGFENFLNTIEQTQPLNFQSLLEKKLQKLQQSLNDSLNVYQHKIDEIDNKIGKIKVERKEVNNFYTQKKEEIKNADKKQVDSLLRSICLAITTSTQR